MIAQFSVDNQITHQHFAPHFADSRAKAVWTRAVSAYERGYPLDFVVTGSKGTFRILMEKERIRQDSDKGALLYEKNKISIKTSKGKKHTDGRKALVPKTASKHGLELDPGVRAWSFDLNPMERLISPATVARVNGSLVTGGAKCDLLELSSPGLKMNLILRHSDGLPIRIFSEVRDPGGHLISSSERKFSYVSIRKPIPESRFSL